MFSGLIHYRIVLHAFVDGFSRLVTGIHATDNNRAETVFNLFQDACNEHGIPCRVRGDHGTENLLVAEFMESNYGVQRGSYIWGRFVLDYSLPLNQLNLARTCRSVHNIRIERLWRDVTRGFGLKWKNFFVDLEQSLGLHPEWDAHIWLLHFLFLGSVQEDAMEWAEVWNNHQVRTGGERSPRDMFFFGQLERGHRDMSMNSPEDLVAPDDPAALDDINNYGVDWESLDDPHLLRHHNAHNERSNMEAMHGDFSETTNRPQHHLSLVEVPEFDSPFTDEEFEIMQEHILQLPEMGSRNMEDRKVIWTQALALCNSFFSI